MATGTSAKGRYLSGEDAASAQTGLHHAVSGLALVFRHDPASRRRSHAACPRGASPRPSGLRSACCCLPGPCHVSADQLLQSLRRSGSRISKATVYNTLNLFSRAGIIREVAVNPSRLVYDSTTTLHHHFLNEDTGRARQTSIPPSRTAAPAAPAGRHGGLERGSHHPGTPPARRRRSAFRRDPLPLETRGLDSRGRGSRLKALLRAFDGRGPIPYTSARSPG